MSKQLRVEYPGALYHITSRGNRKKPIFNDDNDRLLFLKNLAVTCKIHNLICFGYCLMKNHYHLLIETPVTNLSVGMRDLNGIYSQKFNEIHGTVGHMFQGRYKAFLIEKDEYLLEVARYVVLNPVRAGLVKHPSNYAWSSFNATCGKIPCPEFLNADQILIAFSKNREVAQNEFAKFVQDGIDERSPFYNLKHNLILGSEEFIYKAWDNKKSAILNLEVPKNERFLGRPSLNELFTCNINKQKRNDLIVFARIRCGYSITEIARYLFISRQAVGYILKKFEKNMVPGRQM